MKRDECVACPAFVRWASLLSLALAARGGDQSAANPRPLNDPGAAAWELVPADRVAEECGLARIELGWAWEMVHEL